MARKNKTYLSPAEDAETTPLDNLTKAQFGRRLHHLMLKRGWKQADLARASGLARDAISVYMRGRCFPSPTSLRALAVALSMRPEELLPNQAIAAVKESPQILNISVSTDDADMAWLKIDRLVHTQTAIEIARLLQNDNLNDRKRSGSAS